MQPRLRLQSDEVACPDADLRNADWTKQAWDLPAYKSAAFFAIIPLEELDKFRQQPIYKAAVAAHLIYDDEWVADWAIPIEVRKDWTASTDATSGITAYGSTNERRKKRRVKLLPTKEK